MNGLDRRGFLRLSAAAALGATSARSIGDPADPEPLPRGDSPSVKTGGIRMVPVDGKFRVWTKRIGPGTPKILTLHGGPGVTHEYFECMEDFLPAGGRAYYYYDQLGSAYSDQPDDPRLWTVERFREEVEQVRSALGLENFHLYGQSWGGMLGIEYALKYQKHLKSLVISNMTASIASYVKYVNELRAKLPREVIATLEKYEATGDFEAPEYQKAMFDEVYRRHLCRLDPRIPSSARSST